MTFFGPLGIAQPWFLLGFLVLPVLWYLLRFVPPQPEKVWFPPLRLLVGLNSKDQSPEKTPWWLILLRVLLAGLLIFAFARPVWNPDSASVQNRGDLLIVVDNSWAAAGQWAKRREAIDNLTSQAEQSGGLVVLASTAGVTDTLSASDFQFEKASVVREQAASLEPAPYRPQRMRLLELLQKHMGKSRSLQIVWLSDGLDYRDGEAFSAGLKKLAGSSGRLSVYFDGKHSPLGLYGVSGASGLEALVMRAGGINSQGYVYAWSGKGERLAEAPYKFSGSEQVVQVQFALPFEMRNQVRRLSLSDNASAGSVYLMDSRSLRYRIGLLSGEANDRSQPLLSPVYYIEKAIKPYAEVMAPTEKNISVALEEVLRANPSVLLLADIGKLVEDDRMRLQEWVREGGFLVRFAGPRLEKHSDGLLPVGLRRGGRALGGALSWGQPQKLANFEKDSPFYGLTINDDVTVSRQVLADPALLSSSGEVWSRLEDGTPLVTARKDKEGWLVLFHVTANSEWSNLPLSGLFVEMLRRLTEKAGLSDGGKVEKVEGGAQGDVSRLAQPARVLSGFGELTEPKASHKPIDVDVIAKKAPGPGAPPGYYELDGGLVAYNVIRKSTVLSSLSGFPSGVVVTDYQKTQSIVLFPWIVLAAALLLIADTFAWLFMNRQTLGKYVAQAVVVFALGAGAFGLSVETAQADEERRKLEFALKASNGTRLAYVLTGDKNIDRVSRQGLSGLSRIVAMRTAVEPSEPMAVDLARDELAFFPILYWPIHIGAKDLSDSVLAKVDAYMRRGGLILFDTRDFQSASTSFGNGNSPAMRTLQRLVGKLNIPRLAPVSEGHVVTKSFYLLRNFPGRWEGGKLWVEAHTHPSSGDQKRARHADGVTSIMITSNDFASAWALDKNSRPVLPIVPGGDFQREMAFRAGINIVMYALTGNYKADQVHVPALLERLGQ